MGSHGASHGIPWERQIVRIVGLFETTEKLSESSSRSVGWSVAYLLIVPTPKKRIGQSRVVPFVGKVHRVRFQKQQDERGVR